jgi:Tetraspanin family
MYVADNDILILITLACSILLFTALLGFTGTLLNSRPILALYALLLWPSLASILAVGYVGYKRSAYALDHKLSRAWSQWYTELGRLMIQDSLRCCGFYTALHDAAPSGRCYPRSALPGCKGRLYRFEKANLGMIWSAAFGVSVLHLVNIFMALLCANHITERFGMGITPKQYRLDGWDVRSDAERIMKVVRPEKSRANSHEVFREDRVERRAFWGGELGRT